MLARLDHFLFPLFSVWGIAAYLHVLQNLLLGKIVTSHFYLSLLFIPVILLEIWFSLRMCQRRGPLKARPLWKRVLILTALAGNVSFWYICFKIWVLRFGGMADAFVVMYFVGPNMHAAVLLLWRSMQWIAVSLFCLWLFMHYVLTVRWHKLRILSAIGIPAAMSGLLFQHQLLQGGIGGLASEKEISAQAGIEQILSVSALRQTLAADPLSPKRLLDGTLKDLNDPIDLRYQPRELCMEPAENAVFVVLGCTHCEFTVSPVLIRKDLGSGAIDYLVSRNNVREIACKDTGSSIFMAPWGTPDIYEISKHDLAILNKIPHQTEGLLPLWEPMGVVRDISGQQLYVFNDQYPAVISYDLTTGTRQHLLNFNKEGYTGLGGASWYGVQSRTSRKLYVMSDPGEHNLFEVDPDTLKILRSLIVKHIGSSLIIDDENGFLYYQSFMFDTLYRINIKALTIDREYVGEYFSRRHALDQQRQVLYVLGYFSGTVFAIDLKSGERLWEVQVGGRPHGMDLKQDALWIHSMSGVYRLDLPTIWTQKPTVQQSSFTWENVKAVMIFFYQQMLALAPQLSELLFRMAVMQHG